MSDARIGRRSFLKLAALGAGTTMAFGQNDTIRHASAEEIKDPFPGSKKVRTICSICSAGCGIEAEVKDGVWIRQDMAMFHPISQGSHCSKGIDQIDLTHSKQRIKYPMKKVGGKWQRISMTQALDEIGAKLKAYREKNPEQVMFLGSAKDSNEQSYYISKFSAMFGTNNLDHQARI